jgi:hypothetical protein
MNARSKTVALAVAGAAAVASGGYAIGSTAGGGGADAATAGQAVAYGGPPPPGAFAHDRGGPPPGAFALAKKLGVSEAKLHAAFEKVEAKQRSELPALLADALGVPESKVADALKSLPRPPGPPGMHGRFHGPPPPGAPRPPGPPPKGGSAPGAPAPPGGW